MNRAFDILASVVGLLLLSPLLILISIIILMDTKGPVIFRQVRAGKNNRDFRICKFTTMHPGSDKSGLITTGESDRRITRSGQFLRKYKLDELPQLWNILIGEMSFVGPRPEVRKYVNLYTADQMRVLSVRPGLTDYASLEFFHEGEMLAASENPEKTYITDIMPAKLKLNLKYIEEKSPAKNLRILLRTMIKIFGVS